MSITINGMTLAEFKEKAKNDPNCEIMLWEWQNNEKVIVNGKVTSSSGNGSLWYKAKHYEGKIEERDGCLYVGGEFVKEI